MMKKKILALLLAAAMLLTLCACAKNDVPKVITPAEGFANGSGTEADPYIIRTAGELLHLQLAVNEQGNEDYLRAHFRLGADIDLGGNPWRAIGWRTDGTQQAFSGTFDGAGHTIENFETVLTEPEGEFPNLLGLFAVVWGMVKDLRVDKCTFSGPKNSQVGAIAAYLNDQGCIENCAAGRRVVIRGDLAGGIVGVVNCGSLKNCSSAAAVTGFCFAGGLVGGWMIPDRSGHYFGMANCSNSGSIVSGRYAGGVVGYLGANNMGEVTLNNCANAGSVGLDTTLVDHEYVGLPALGGIIGRVRGGEKQLQIGLLACSNAGTVTAEGEAALGGILGEGGAEGGITLLSCSNAGDVSCGDGFAGGLLGRLCNEADVYVTFLPKECPGLILTGCTNSGAVTGGCAGGLAGDLRCGNNPKQSVILEQSLNSASVTARAGGMAGGLIGALEAENLTASLTGCTNDGDVGAEESDEPLEVHLGGLIGCVIGEKQPSIEASRNNGKICGNEDEQIYYIREN